MALGDDMGFWTEVNQDALTVSPDMAAISPAQRGFLRNFEIANGVSLSFVAILVAVIIVGILLARATALVARSPDGRTYVQANALGSLVGLASSASVLVMAVVGYVFTHWYWPTGSLVAAFALSGLLVNGATAIPLYRLHNILGLLVIGATVFSIWHIWR